MLDEKKLEEKIQLYNPRKADLNSLSDYDRIAMTYHTSEEQISFSNFSLTLALNINSILNNYNENYKNSSSSFISFFIFKLNNTIHRLKKFNYRYINGNWYYFDEMPMTLPITYKNEYRFIVLDKFTGIDWLTFSNDYRTKVNNAKSGKDSMIFNLEFYYAFGNFFSNFPYLNITSLTPHTVVYKRTAGLMYFATGKISDGKIPFSVTTHHSTSNGNNVNDLIKNFINELNN